MKKQQNSTPHKSDEYDAQIQDIIPYYTNFHNEIIEFIKSQSNEPKIWLDTGCGTGALIKKAIEVFNNTKFLLMDPSKDMIEEARKKLRDLDEERIIFLEPVATQNFPGKLDEKPDIITAIQCHHYLKPSDRIKAIGVCYNLLKENGTFITFENIRPFTSEGIEMYKRYWEDFQLKMGRDDETVSGHMERFDKEYFPINIEEHLEILRKAGFRVVELFWFSYMQAGFYCTK
jgi:tRNA (cmo5U34)-methyltransferase